MNRKTSLSKLFISVVGMRGAIQFFLRTASVLIASSRAVAGRGRPGSTLGGPLPLHHLGGGVPVPQALPPQRGAGSARLSPSRTRPAGHMGLVGLAGPPPRPSDERVFICPAHIPSMINPSTDSPHRPPLCLLDVPSHLAPLPPNPSHPEWLFARHSPELREKRKGCDFGGGGATVNGMRSCW